MSNRPIQSMQIMHIDSFNKMWMHKEININWQGKTIKLCLALDIEPLRCEYKTLVIFRLFNMKYEGERSLDW